MNHKHSILNSGAARLAVSSALLAALATLAGCGGGNASTPIDLSSSVTITGTVATSIAKVATPFANADVVAYCAKGNGSALTKADGSFSVTIAKPGVGPCVVSVFKSDNAAPYLRTVAAGSGVANITPITELLTQEISAQVSTVAIPLTTSTNNSLSALPEHPGFTKLMADQNLLNAAIARVSEITKTFPAVSATAPAYTTPVLTTWLTGSLVVGGAGNDQSAFLVALANRGVISATGTVSGTTATEVARQGALNPVTTP